MLSTLEGLKDDFSNLAGVLNRFRSEAVQVKLLDRLFEIFQPSAASAPGISHVRTRRAPRAVGETAETVEIVAPKRRGRPPKVVAEVAILKRRGRPPKPQVLTEKPQQPKGRKGKRHSMGATGALYALIAKGYFKQRHSIAEIVAACDSKVGVPVKVTNLSGPLGNFVEQKKLMRARNNDGRFEYWAK